MAQRPKEHVRQAILSAAARELADAGYEGATLASIAARAETSVGNVYKYFRNKDELFAATVPEDLVREAGALLRGRVQALGRARDVSALDSQHAYQKASERLLLFSLAHRHGLLFLLRHAEHTEFATFREDIASDLTKSALAYAAKAYPSARFNAARRRALSRIYRAFLVSIAAILETEQSERALREAVEHLTTYHLAGLSAFFQAATACSEPEEEST